MTAWIGNVLDAGHVAELFGLLESQDARARAQAFTALALLEVAHAIARRNRG
jgi:hypothetical protein